MEFRMRSSKWSLFYYVFVSYTLCVWVSASNYILNGTDAPLTPHHAHIRIHPERPNPQNTTFVGSGTLISTIHVVTCAQNIFGFARFEVGVGSINRHELTYYKSMQQIVHPEYNPTTLDNNIGIIYLQMAVEWRDTVKPLSLVAPNMVLPFPMEQGTITGFGLIHGNRTRFPTKLQQGFHRVLSAADCRWRYPHLANVSVMTHFCGLDDDRQRSNICGGDQGTGFTVMLRGVLTLVGIASFTERNCVQELGAVYVRVSHYRPWIFNETGV